jgi:deoxyribodipyrimidine photo-lyase
MDVPEIRIRPCNEAPVHSGADFVLYWMIAARRTNWNFALDRAVEWAQRLSKPLVILEALRAGYPWASGCFQRFVLAGMRDNAASLESKTVVYYPYLESAPGEGKGLLESFASHAAIVVTDEFPCFFLPRMVAAAARRIPVLMEQVDSNGLLPLRATSQAFPTAYAFRRFLQKQLPEHLLATPRRNPFERVRLPRLSRLPREITSRWPKLMPQRLAVLVCGNPEEGSVHVPTGGAAAAQKRLGHFVRTMLADYEESRNEPDRDASSGLSPYLHFGHISAHQIFAEVASKQDWRPDHLALRANGSRAGWWGMPPSAESFLDQLVTWRELGFNLCHHRADYDQYESLPEWARKTLELHASDSRAYCYTLQDFESAETHDPLWNAAQTQLAREGRIHNYLRMLWGKKILEWSPSPRKALATMIELNNKYALDGRDPNSYNGIFWCLGRYDRPWGPERPIFGKVRYMSSENTARKMSVSGYLRKYQHGLEVESEPPVRKRKARP